ncbi:MAG: DUF4920 domain-containing protein [Denitrovibrio sp.]|mgnify:CR=1 FL=1|nr:MAG: DUF4920 domain-containing protein [Denitrovibrio sp.]
MKKCLILLVLVLFTFSAFAEAPIYLGEKITLTKVTKMSELLANRAKYQGKKVLVEGLIIDVCAARGCWMALAGDVPFEHLTISVEDGVIIFPMHAKGRTALAEGTFDAYDLNLEETIESLQHKAEEKGEKFDPKSVTKPITEYTIFTTGAVIK